MTSFRLQGEEAVYDGHVMRVVVGTFEGPDGDTFTRDIIRHPGAVAVLPLHEDGTVTLVRQYRAPLDEHILEIPAGIRDVEDEPTEQTAVRELAEEVGLEAEHLEHLVSFHNAPGMSDEVVEVYLATGLRSVDADAQGPEEEAMTIERHHLDDLATMIGDGQLTDAKTVIAVALVRAR
ncbi:MAG TPA: NUDIX hydrolase [Acidimicrobiales bacterium]|nr:NUDIX hydrolase [Acidimicrobiales bacterium]